MRRTDVPRLGRAGLVVGLLGACASGDPVLLLDHAAWVLVTDGADPWAADAPVEGDCAPASFFVEEGYFEVSTDGCGWGTWAQPLSEPVKRGDRLEMELFHQALWAPFTTTAVVALAIDEEVVVSWSAPVPSDAGRYDLVGEVERRRRGTAFLHIHNHGLNSYRVGDVWAR